jgi:hypothetical protein
MDRTDRTLTCDVNDVLQNWEVKLQENEAYLAQSFGGIIQSLEPWQAFALIPEAVDIVLAQTDPSLVVECFNLLFDLYGRADTTEIPPYLAQNWNRLVRHVTGTGSYGQRGIEALRQFLHLKYRMPLEPPQP